VERVRALLSELVDLGLARQSPGDYPTLLLTPEGGAVLGGRADVAVSLPATRPAGSRASAAPMPQDGDPAILERLRSWRSALAQQRRVPAYVILADRTLAALSARRPPCSRSPASDPRS
jgi:ATP-dependent DNA helicase RecQ